MGDVLQRNSLGMNAPRVADVSFGQFGMPKFNPTNSVGAPANPFGAAPTGGDAPPQDLNGDGIPDWVRPMGEGLQPLPFSRDELQGLLRGGKLIGF